MLLARRRDLGIFWLLSALWSGNWLWIKIGLAGLPPFRFAGLRLALACVLLAPFVLRRPRPTVSPGEARWIALVGFLQIGVSYACVFTAEQWIDSGLTALIFASFAMGSALRTLSPRRRAADGTCPPRDPRGTRGRGRDRGPRPGENHFHDGAALRGIYGGGA